MIYIYDIEDDGLEGTSQIISDILCFRSSGIIAKELQRFKRRI